MYRNSSARLAVVVSSLVCFLVIYKTRLFIISFSFFFSYVNADRSDVMIVCWVLFMPLFFCIVEVL